MSRYILVPVQGGQSKEINLPANLYNPSPGNDPLITACTRVFLIENGNIHHNGVDFGCFRDFIKDAKKRKFSNKYKDIYSVLNYIGVKL